MMLTACDGVIYDDEGDCSVTYRVKFRYDHNLKFADAFAHEVKSVTLYVIDDNGSIVWQRTESGEALQAEDYAMTVDIEPGTYDLMAWCSGSETGQESFTIPDSNVKTGLTCTLNRERDDDGSACVRDGLNHLYYGRLEAQTFGETEGIYTYTVPLIKDTNSVRVVLQHLSGLPVDKDKFTFAITDDNGSMDWDNSLLPDETIKYYAWHTEQGEAEIGEPAGQGRAVSGIGSRSTFSAAIAELTVARLIKGRQPRLTITNDSGETIFSYPLIDLALMVKGYDNRDMDDQEYLDRQDEYNMVFFLDEGDRWLSAYIYINSWKIVLQQTGI